MRIQTRPTAVSARESNDSSPFLGVSNNSNGSSFRSDSSRSGEGGYIYLVEVQYYLRLHTGQVTHRVALIFIFVLILIFIFILMLILILSSLLFVTNFDLVVVLVIITFIFTSDSYFFIYCILDLTIF